MSDERAGRPRDTRLHHAILDATRELLTTGGYAELSMESIAARAGVGKKTLYRRWPSKAPLVAEAVLETYGGTGSFPVAETGDLRADLQAWLREHADFLARPSNAALVRALIAAAAARPADGDDLYQQLSAPQLDGLTTRLRRAVRDEELSAAADLDAIAEALIGTMLFRALTHGGATDFAAEGPRTFDGLLDAILHGAATTKPD
ncbi:MULTISPECIES: TetR/AcrR family transcriptional regulator [Mycobacterium]|uniref:TetR family transcriptional regulator n=1 Tax=Mycobacterium paraintracellulare TaxID=1138383 RepID=A0ABM7K8H8_9MYCO|nr:MULTISPECIES: TetR/AcrR family transcriptional regulator [Mycobacterium]AFC52175.1 TetR family transcriptional regulator [Mycobacterium paraintracellulare]MCA2247003.1 TetR/AcrR family transcriptional regulator [Mycobacterium intracellulare]OSC29496.1 TetR family transcriptional regulator [Mycobacterium paraintracellulare]UGU01968.1 TetR/AcrR family transcriptional regulator [Mycobacterium intracellulare]UQB93032.1 TetR/AcrR family transcriptional regulator [Mycobacterium intracellulare]